MLEKYSIPSTVAQSTLDMSNWQVPQELSHCMKGLCVKIVQKDTQIDFMTIRLKMMVLQLIDYIAFNHSSIFLLSANFGTLSST